MREDEAKEVLEETGAIITGGHFILDSGRHTPAYVEKYKIFSSALKTYKLCKGIAEDVRSKEIEIEIVVGPFLGGISVAEYTAYHLNMLSFHEADFKEILVAFAEEEPDGRGFFIIEAHKKLVPGQKVLIVDDVLTTGGTVNKVIKAVEGIGGKVVAVAVICNRGGVIAEDLGVPELSALTNIALEDWSEEECPLCAKGVPINTDIGKGKEYLAKKAKETS